MKAFENVNLIHSVLFNCYEANIEINFNMSRKK
jgi:hypothetical protein